jgi:mono/diheme cytochrome c family protein
VELTQVLKATAEVGECAISAISAVAFLLTAATVARAQPPSGEKVFARVCEQCHGPKANGDGQGPALVPYSKELSELTGIVRQGLGQMPAIPRSEISDDEITQVHAYLKELTAKSARAARPRHR